MVLVDLRRRGLISGGYAAKALGITKSEFIDLLAKYEVPYLAMSEAEFLQELEVARAYFDREPSSSQTPGR
jgi:hypothetical protein